MKAYAVMAGLLVGLAGTGCPSDTFLCENVQDCIGNGNSCPSGQELFCNYELGGVCDCADGTGGSGGSAGTGGTGGDGGTGGSAECDACVGTDVGPLGDPNPVVSCAPTNEPSLCSCLDDMGTRHNVYLSSGGCY